MNTVLSVSAASASAACYAWAAVAQERLAAASRHCRVGAASWLPVVGFNGAGAGLHTVALRFGSLSVVQALGTLALVLALPLGAAVGWRRVSAAQWRGAALTVLGLLALLAAAVPPAAGHPLDHAEGLLLGAVAVAAAAALAWLRTGSARPVLRSVRCAVAAGAAFATASCLAQSLVMEVSEHGVRHSAGQPAVLATAALTAALAVAGLVWSQAAYHSGLAVGMAVVSVANPVVASGIGVVLLGDRFRSGTVGILCAVAGAFLAGRGVVILARPAPAQDLSAPLQESARQPIRLTGTSPATPFLPPSEASRLQFPVRPGPRAPSPDGMPRQSGSIQRSARC